MPTTLYATTVNAVGSEVPELMEAGVLILFGAGAPPELAEISVVHAVDEVAAQAPKPGDAIVIGAHRLSVTAIGESAWGKLVELGHVALTFNAAATPDKPGEICVAGATPEDVLAELKPGTRIIIAAA